MAKGVKGLDWVVKIILVILCDTYGIAARITSGKTVPMIVVIMQIFTANIFGILWLVDLTTIIFKKEVTHLA